MAVIPELALDPFSDAFLADPYAHHDALRDAGPVVYLPSTGCYAMARYAQVNAALKDWESFTSARGVGLADFAHEEPWRPPSLLLEADPPLHDRTRGLMNKVASLASLRAVMPDWQAKADALIDGALAKHHIDAVADIAEAFPLSVFPDLIGLRDGGRGHLLAYGATAFNAFGPRNALLEQSLAAAGEATAWVMESCQRHNLRADGWGASVYSAADRGECSHAEAERLVRSFLTAGVDTTVNGIANMLLAFARYPDQWSRLRAEPGLARKAFEESLRWDGTVQTFFRTTSREMDIAGSTLPADAKVILYLAAANRDPRHWPNADQFDITRTSSGHVGFGFGIHQCLGQMVARLEAEAVLMALIPRVAEIRLSGSVERRLNNTLRAVSSLPLELICA